MRVSEHDRYLFGSEKATSQAKGSPRKHLNETKKMGFIEIVKYLNFLLIFFVLWLHS